MHLIPGLLVHRDGFARQGALIDRTCAFQHRTVHRDLFTRPDQKHIPCCHFFNVYGNFLPVPYHRGTPGGKLHKGFQGAGGLSLAVGFQHLSHGDQGQNHGGRFKVEGIHPDHGCFAAPVHLGIRHGKEGVYAPHKGCRRTHGHQGIHIGCPVPDGLETGDEELPVDQHHNGCQDHLHKTHGHVVSLKPGRYREAPHHMTHGKIHEDQQENKGCQQPSHELWGLMILQHFLLVRLCLFRPRASGCSAVSRLFHS